ncbi:MAG: phage holin family protein [Desulfobacteraceae bacterium]|nr:MAG: phage holin family protein [Desulfobacteraceae bacterium]
MTRIIIKWLALTAAIMVTSYLIDGISVAGISSAFLAAAVLGILNVFLRPIALILTLPVNILSIGLFTFVINAFMLIITSKLIPGFNVNGFWAAIIGSLLISIVSWAINIFASDKVSVKTVKSNINPDYIDLENMGDDKWE